MPWLLKSSTVKALTSAMQTTWCHHNGCLYPMWVSLVDASSSFANIETLPLLPVYTVPKSLSQLFMQNTVDLNPAGGDMLDVSQTLFQTSSSGCTCIGLSKEDPNHMKQDVLYTGRLGAQSGRGVTKLALRAFPTFLSALVMNQNLGSLDIWSKTSPNITYVSHDRGCQYYSSIWKTLSERPWRTSPNFCPSCLPHLFLSALVMNQNLGSLDAQPKPWFSGHLE